MRTRLACLVFVAALAAPSIAAAAEVTGLQLTADGLFARANGSIASAGDAKLTDLYGNGGGGDITASMGLRRRLFAAVRVGWVKYGEQATRYQFTEIPPPLGSSVAPGAGPFDVLRDLKAIPVHALIQYRHANAGRAGWYAEAGAGLISFVEKMKLNGGSGELFEIDGYQHAPSWTVGAGIELPARGNLGVVVGVRCDGTLTDDGAIWASGDNPRFVSGAIGIRYPRVTH